MQISLHEHDLAKPYHQIVALTHDIDIVEHGTPARCLVQDNLLLLVSRLLRSTRSNYLRIRNVLENLDFKASLKWS